MAILLDPPIVRCGKPAAKGPCKHKLRGGLCPVHDNLEAFNVRMRDACKRGGAARSTQFDSEYQRNARAHVKTESLRKSGRAGFDKVGGMVWWAEQTEKARLWRVENPSAHERTVIEVLLCSLALDVHYERECILEGDPRAVDFVMFVQGRRTCAIEVTESARHTTFGRDEKLQAKVAWLESLDLPVHLFYGGDDLQTELDRLGQFLHAHQLI